MVLKHYFVICDQEQAYIERLAEFILTRNMTYMDLEIFSDEAMAASFCTSHRVKCLLVHEDVFGQSSFLREDMQAAERLFFLTENPDAEDDTHIYKYQSADAIINRVMCLESDQPSGMAKGSEPSGARLRYIGIYSPVSRASATPFALVTACMLARSGQTLYLNLRSFSGVEGILGKADCPDLSDVMYYMQSGRTSLSDWGESCIYSYDCTDYIYPAVSPADLQDISLQDWQQLLASVSAQGKYRFLVLELESGTRGYLELLEMCDTIYMPVLQDGFSECQARLFFELLPRLQKQHLLSKVRTVTLPKLTDEPNGQWTREQLMGGELAKFAQALLQDSGYGK